MNILFSDAVTEGFSQLYLFRQQEEARKAAEHIFKQL